MQPGKVQYLECLRGVAEIQVVLLHFVTGFLPYAGERIPAPLRVLYDGHTAVYLFFLISGAVLTPSFARSGPFVAKLVKRVVRLGIPVAAAGGIATALLAVWPDAHVRAAGLTRSSWLAMDSSGAATLAHLAREIGLDSLLLGYREATLFGPFAGQLPPMALSLDAPFWSLHLELYGSLLVLCLVSLRAYSVWWHCAAIIAAILLFGTHPMFLFVLGHLSSVVVLGLDPAEGGPGLGEDGRVGSVHGAKRGGLFGALLILLGVALCASKDWQAVEWSRQMLSRSEIAAAPSLFQFQSQLGAAALYFGVLLCPPVWWPLGCTLARRLGRLSFSIYLLHFPILFTVVCLAFIRARGVFSYAASVALAFALFLLVTLLAGIAFERLIDRPAIALSRRAGMARLQLA